MGRYNSPPLKEFSSSKIKHPANNSGLVYTTNNNFKQHTIKQQVRTTKDNVKLLHNTTLLDTTLLLGRTDRPALIPIVTPRSPNNEILIIKSE